MKYCEFEDIMSIARMSRYKTATSSNTRKAMTLYRLNLRLCQELFAIIWCIEVALRNSINRECLSAHGGAGLTFEHTIYDTINLRSIKRICIALYKEFFHLHLQLALYQILYRNY